MPKKQKTKKYAPNPADLALVGIFIVAAAVAYFNIQNPNYTMLLGLGGAIVAIENIRRSDEVPYMISVATLLIVIGAIGLVSLPPQISIFLANIAVAFGISGLIVSLGKIVKLSWKR